jgi:hypothetical protein
VETGAYLVMLGTKGESILEEAVYSHLGMSERRGFNLYLAGVAWLIYAECSGEREPWLYAKVKMARRKAEEMLREAYEIDD